MPDGGEIVAWVFDDADSSGDTSRPYLVFDPVVGAIVIADDYETTNDEAAQFMITKDDAIELATALLIYARKTKEQVL